MLTKEECMDALNKMINTSYSRWYRSHGKTAKPYFLDGFHKNPVYKGDYKALKVIDKLIKEYFELVEHAKKLQNEVDYYKHEYFSMCDLIENPQPYKFEELKKGMWVWMVWFKEGAEKGEFAKILNTYTTPPYYYNDEDGEEHERVEFRIGDGSGTIDFDAWKFYPPTKAMEYQK